MSSAPVETKFPDIIALEKDKAPRRKSDADKYGAIKINERALAARRKYQQSLFKAEHERRKKGEDRDIYTLPFRIAKVAGAVFRIQRHPVSQLEHDENEKKNRVY